MAQVSANTSATLQGLFKQIYAKEVKDLVPAFSILQKRVPFSKAQILGDKFHCPVVLSQEHGFTYGGSTAANYALNAAVSMQMQDAQVPGSELTLQSGISYGAVSRAQSKGDTAVEQAVRLLAEQMKASASKRLEIALIYGGSGLGRVASGTGSSTTRVYTIQKATFAPGIWSGMENANLDFYNGASQLNANAMVVITAVNVALQTVSVSGNAADLTAIDGAGTSASIFFSGAYGQEMTGIDQIMVNTGTLFNISASQFNLWAAQTYDCGLAEISMTKLLSAIALAVGRGLMDDVQVLLSPDSWANLNSDLGAQRQYDGSYSKKKAENGFESIQYYGQNGIIELISHPMVKSGEAFVIPLDLIQRVGSTDVAFRGEGPSGEEEYLFQNPTTNGWTCRAYTDQAILIEMPAHCVKLINIVAS